MASSRIADDWQAAYGRRPLVAYTYVAPEHTGTCYAAAGWSCCDEPTSGMPPGHEAPGAQRRVWMKPLAADWKAGLCAAPGKLIEEPRPVYLEETADWADHEYARCRHPDGIAMCQGGGVVNATTKEETYMERVVSARQRNFPTHSIC